MDDRIDSVIQASVGAKASRRIEMIQALWSGYGELVRYAVSGLDLDTVIVKAIRPDSEGTHPRGWDSRQSHGRKLRSYEVEALWYSHYASLTDEHCRVPQCFASEVDGTERILVLEDLDSAGFTGRGPQITERRIHLCLAWLAYFHARFLGESPVGLWPEGTYWHLDTRPDELIVLAKEDPDLWKSAEAIDVILRGAKFQTFVHGDAKLANFCFAAEDQAVAAVDFQYVGGGCGMKDIAYFLGSCLDESACEANENALLDFYFQKLREACALYSQDICFDELEAEWRNLYPFAWTDFHRFLKGWSPGHWKINSYSEQLARRVIMLINQPDLEC